MSTIQIGRILSAATTEFVVGCRVNQLNAPGFGNLVRVPVVEDIQTYGLIYDIRINDDGLVRQLGTAHGVDEAVINDNRVNRNMPVEMSVLVVGYQQGNLIKHLLPPRPALSLDMITQCSPEEVVAFTSAGRFGYLRHVLRDQDKPVGELLAAHIAQADAAHRAAGDETWGQRAAKELITLLRDDYATLMTVLSALGDALPE